jgi:predicted helicase
MDLRAFISTYRSLSSSRIDDGNITSDPNDADNDQFIPQLIERVTTVSLQTLETIRSLPPALDFSPLGVTAASL